jgi:hypothetical protein
MGSPCSPEEYLEPVEGAFERPPEVVYSTGFIDHCGPALVTRAAAILRGHEACIL